MNTNNKEIQAGVETNVTKNSGTGPGISTNNDNATNGKPKKTIEVDEQTLKDLIQAVKSQGETIEKLSSHAVTQSPNLQVRRKTREFDYKLRKWNNKIVLGFENMGSEKRPLYVYSVYDKDLRKEVQFINLILNGVKDVVKKVDYITFLRDAESIKARMLSKEEHEDIKEYGMIPKKEMAENGYGMFETMVLVPVEVVTKTYTMTLQLPADEGGETIKVSSEWLNM